MVMDYSRRGSGESGDTLPYDAYREIEDLAALINIVQARAGQAAGSVDAARQVKISWRALLRPRTRSENALAD
jgi:hypothetical protein